MASSTREVRGMEEVITCSICHEMFTDARTLNCQHCFCLACLQDFQTTAVVKPCPVCREDCVPAARELHRLPPNRAVNDMVGVLVKHREKSTAQGVRSTRCPPPAYQLRVPVATPSRPIATIPPKRTVTTPPKRAVTTPPKRPTSPTVNSLLGELLGIQQTQSRLQEQRAEALAESLTEAFVGAFISGARSEALGNVHRGVQCDECLTDNIRGVRYKCGVCEDYDLCQRCEQLPRSSVHDRKHIFIKLRRQCTRSVPRGQVIQPTAFRTGQKMRFDSNEHIMSVQLNVMGLPLPISVAIDCDRCGEKPIEGKRFKCGMCDNYDLCEDCEGQSQSFHPSDHVFLIIPHPSHHQQQTSGSMLRYRFY